MPDGPGRGDHVVTPEPARWGRNRLPRLQGSAFRDNATAFLRDLRTARTVDRTAYATAGHQFRVGCIHNRICGILCEVATHQPNPFGIATVHVYHVVLVPRQLPLLNRL